jgi:hypothetical protein
VSANSTSPAIGVSGRAAPGAVMMNSILGATPDTPNHVNIELAAVKGS